MNRRRFIFNAAGLLVPAGLVRGSVPVPLGFWKRASGCSASAVTALNDWVTRVQGQSSDVTGAGVQAAVCTYIDGLITDGVWDKLFRHSIYAGDGLNALKAPLKNGGPVATDNLVNFVSGDYSQAAGLTGNTTSKYIDTGLPISSGSSDDEKIHLSVYVRTGSDEATTTMGADSSSFPFPGTNLFVSDGGITYFDCNKPSGSQRISFSDSNGTGHYIGSRLVTNDLNLYKNGTSMASNTGTAGGVRPGESLFVHAYNSGGGTPAGWTSRTLEMYSIGEGLTATDVTNFTARYATLRTALGR